MNKSKSNLKQRILIAPDFRCVRVRLTATADQEHSRHVLIRRRHGAI